MRALFSPYLMIIIAASALGGSAVAGKPAGQASKPNEQPSTRTIFVTGSLIPQRIQVKQIGTTTVSPIRVIDRREIDATGRRTTRGVLIADPSVRAVGH